jgi:L-ribulokinase
MSERYVIGVDYGTLSGRALVVRARDGAELASAVHEYRHGVIDETLPVSGQSLGADWALQDPEDYLDVLRHAVPAAILAAGIDAGDVVGIATDFTACTVLPTLADGTPLCRVPGVGPVLQAPRLREAVEASRRTAPGRSHHGAGP